MIKLISTKESAKFFNYSYGRYFSMGVLSMVGIIFIVGFCLLFYGILVVENVLGIFLILFSLSLFIPTEIFQINLETKEYRNVVKIFNYTTNPQWNNLRNVQYLSIVNRKKSLYSSGYDARLENKNTFQDCVLRFFIKAGYTIEVDEYKHKENAIYIGKIIATGLNIKLLDATVQPSEFIDLN